MTRFRILVAAVAVVLLWSCGQGGSDSTEVWQKERDNIVKVEVVSIGDSLPAMHAHSNPVCVIGDTLIFKDSQSTDYIFTAYDMCTGKTLRQFGKYGVGPGEIANFGSPFVDVQNRILYGINGGQWVYVGFELDKAISDPNYQAFAKAKIANEESMMPLLTCDYLNDSTVIGSAWYPAKDWTSFEFRIGSLNLIDGSVSLLTGSTLEERAMYHTSASKENQLIVATGTNVDRINLYDLTGKLKKIIYGPCYQPEVHKGRYYNCTPVITDDRIFFVYRDPERMKDLYGEEIVELDHEGNYLRTLRVGIPIINIQYNPRIGRMYFGSTAEPQFGYIQL